jgi:hypothetical protein
MKPLFYEQSGLGNHLDKNVPLRECRYLAT